MFIFSEDSKLKYLKPLFNQPTFACFSFGCWICSLKGVLKQHDLTFHSDNLGQLCTLQCSNSQIIDKMAQVKRGLTQLERSCNEHCLLLLHYLVKANGKDHKNFQGANFFWKPHYFISTHQWKSTCKQKI